ncbi:hypothetical protein EG865_15710, partial [Enterococcus faecalis]
RPVQDALQLLLRGLFSVNKRQVVRPAPGREPRLSACACFSLSGAGETGGGRETARAPSVGETAG